MDVHRSLLHTGHELLQPTSLAGTAPRPRLRQMMIWLALCGFLYGMAMGTFGGVTGQRLLQVFYSAVKVPLLLTVTFALTLPSFFVINTLMGLRSDFGRAVRAVVTTQAVLAIVLAALAPYTLLWYRSSADYPSATLFNGLIFATASLAAQVVLRQHYRPLIAANPRHRVMLWSWLVVYAFVAIQMAWLLRPFIGDPTQPVEFFRDEAFDNAYVVVAKLIWNAVAGYWK